ncbi:MAG: beta galactosidase jelly roll domain-containing protein [Pirellulaceae bacterium]
MTRHTLTFVTIFILLAFGLTVFAEPRFVAPNSEAELNERLKELREEYTPYLRSLPEKVDVRKRTSLNGHWKFTFEVKDPPKQDTPPPPAPKWFGADFDDSAWETTTVPEWRYRTVGHDNLYTRKVDQVKITGNNRNTSNICWYRRSFKTDKPKNGERLWLRFDGVQWEAQVYLNGEFIGSHLVYYEPFGFDITDKIKPGENTLAVRVINGKVYGEPVWAWTLFPDIRAEQQRYTPNKEESIIGNLPIGYHTGGGFGIWGDVYLETTGPVRIDEIFVRNDLSSDSARIKIELDSATRQKAKLNIQIMPENCDAKTYKKAVTATLPAGTSVQEMTIPMPDAKIWSPATPNLYRCRVSVADDVKDVLFGCRSFTIVHREVKAPAYEFKPIKAKWLRIAGRASDKSTWNSIWEVAGKAIVRDPERVTTSGAQQGYPASMALDGDENTRWAVDGPAWIQFKLDPNIAFDELTIAWPRPRSGSSGGR